MQRQMNIITGAFAVNTDVADLSGLTAIRPNYQNRILIGGKKIGGHGVGKINELGAEIARYDSDKIIEAIRETAQFAETDAFLLCAGAAGGTGSGAISIITQHLKERYVEKPIYNLIVLPFAHEEETEGRTIYNSATCLKSAYLVADAIFLVNNQRYISKNSSMRGNYNLINSLIVEPFYDLLCAGEETKPQYIGSRILDAGDIIQTLAGWTVIGYSKQATRRMKSPFDFRDKIVESQRGAQVINNAITELSLHCNPEDAGRGLYLVTSPPKQMDMNLIKDLGSYLKSIAPEALIRTGDYPRAKKEMNITVILSELSRVTKIADYFTKTIELIATMKRRKEGTGVEYRDLAEAFRDIPSLL